MSGIAHYKVATPPSPQAIEEFAKRIANYCNIFTEDSHYASQDPTTRDQVMATMYEGPGFESTLSPYALVPHGDYPDEYLAHVDAEIGRISSKKALSTEEFVLILYLVSLYSQSP